MLADVIYNQLLFQDLNEGLSVFQKGGTFGCPFKGVTFCFILEAELTSILPTLRFEGFVGFMTFGSVDRAFSLDIFMDFRDFVFSQASLKILLLI